MPNIIGHSRTYITLSLLSNSSVVILYYKLADAFMLGSICYAVAAIRDRELRWPGGEVTGLGIGLMIASEFLGPVPISVGVGLMGLGFTLIALRALLASRRHGSGVETD